MREIWKRKGSVLAGLLFFSAPFFSFPALAQQTPYALQDSTRSYHYESINDLIHVNRDTTIDVIEDLTFQFIGNYHVATRDIPFDKIGAITDIEVTDVMTGAPLTYSGRRLDKLDPTSWGKYTYWSDGSAEHIEWYYNLSDTTHMWALLYKVHGAIAFGSDQDRLYWNIATNYMVPINAVVVSVTLPEAVHSDKHGIAAYRTQAMPVQANFDGTTFSFSTSHIAPGEAFTIDASWPHGMVNESAYWWDFFYIYYGDLLAVVIVIAGLLLGIGFNLKLKWRENDATIVPEYEPPEHLPPAIAEMVTQETITERGLAATIVDLAIRGYLIIEEKPSLIGRFTKKSFPWLSNVLSVLLAVIVLGVFFSNSLFGGSAAFFSIFPVLIIFFIFLMIISARKADYILKKKKSFADDNKLRDYEKKYLSMLFAKKVAFSTKDARGSGFGERTRLEEGIQKIKESIFEESGKEGVFEANMKKRAKWMFSTGSVVTIIGVIAFILVLEVGLQVSGFLDQMAILLAAGVITGVSLWSYMYFRLHRSQKGILLNREWLGFKMFLEVTGRDRMQNLTPDMFEKYLPYAMVFGVEKKWAKAFDGMNIPQPRWYAGPAVVSGSFGGSGGGSSGFSASAFSASFASSFSSSFGGSAGGGGGGAGGGGAGGGGGGGGGGAG